MYAVLARLCSDFGAWRGHVHSASHDHVRPAMTLQLYLPSSVLGGLLGLVFLQLSQIPGTEEGATVGGRGFLTPLETMCSCHAQRIFH